MNANRKARALAYVLGSTTIACSGYGLYYCYGTAQSVATGDYISVLPEHDAPHFYEAFWIMLSSPFCGACVLAGACARSNTVEARALQPFPRTLHICRDYFAFIGTVLWPSPTFGMSVAMVTGIANGAMEVPLLVLLPLWGPIAFYWSRKQPKRVAKDSFATNARASWHLAIREEPSLKWSRSLWALRERNFCLT